MIGDLCEWVLYAERELVKVLWVVLGAQGGAIGLVAFLLSLLVGGVQLRIYMALLASSLSAGALGVFVARRWIVRVLLRSAALYLQRRPRTWWIEEEPIFDVRMIGKT